MYYAKLNRDYKPETMPRSERWVVYLELSKEIVPQRIRGYPTSDAAIACAKRLQEAATNKTIN